jgi:hypothetical protein
MEGLLTVRVGSCVSAQGRPASLFAAQTIHALE